MKISTAIDEYLKWCTLERHLSKNTILAYKSDLSDFIHFAGDGHTTDKLKLDIIRPYFIFLYEKRRLSIITAKRRIACLRSFCSFIQKTASIEDPFTGWVLEFKVPKRLPRVLTKNEIMELISFNPTHTSIDYETIFCILLFSATGLRVSELCSIQAKRVSLDGSSIYINGKGSRERLVYIGNVELQESMAVRREARIRAEGPDSYMFLNSKKSPLQPQTLRQRIHNLGSKTALSKRVTPHMLRHSAATFLIESGIDIRYVQRLLGHSSISTTELYTNVSDSALRQAICKADTVRNLMAKKQI